MTRRHFSRPVYEGLPWFYITFGIVALIASYLLAARGPLVHVDQFMLADQDDIAVVQVMAAHASGLHVDPVGAVQVLDVARMGRGDHLAVMTADEAAVDLHVIVGRAADDDPPDP